MHRFTADLRHGLRVLLRTPGVTATALLAIALAIGANTAMFSVVDAVLLEPLPFADPDRIVMVWEDASQIGFPRNTPAPANWRDWRAENTVFTDIAATRGWAYTLTGGGTPERMLAHRVTANFWNVLGARPLLGRTFTAREDETGAKVAVLSYGLWQRRLGGDRAAIGRKVLLNGEPYVVIGVMPPRFSFPHRRNELWTPASFTPEDLARRSSHFLQCVARLQPGVTAAQAGANMRAIARRLEQRYPETNAGVGAVVVPMAEQMAGKSRARLLALFAASGFVLLIACANLANLLLARTHGRRREIAVRTALGAGRGVIVRQLLTESLLLAGLGAVAGLALAKAGMIALENLIPPEMALEHLTLDLRVLVFATGATLLSGLLFGALPALALGRADLHATLREAGRGAGGGRRHWLRDSLVVAQTALALALVAGAGLMVQTLYNLEHVDLGFRSNHLLTASTEPMPGRYATHDAQLAFFNAVLARVRAIPGVLAAGYTSTLPLMSIGNTSGYVLEGQTSVEANTQDALFRVVSAGFLQTIGAGLREGRFFGDTDRKGGWPVVIVNETFADRHWRGLSVIGKRLDISGGPPDKRKWVTVVGVVKEIRERGINIETKPAVYMPMAQSEGYWPDPGDLVVRTAVDPRSVARSVRQAVWSVDKDQPVSLVRTMDEVVAEELSRERQQMGLFGVFAGLALALAGTGVYAVLAYLVSQRRREIGVRMALGATPAGILRQTLGRAAALVGAGTFLGLALALAAARLMAGLLYGVAPQDAATLAAAAVILAAVGLAGSAIPARSAARVDPAIVLRED